MRNYIQIPESLEGIVAICAVVGGYVILRRVNDYVHFENVIFGKEN